MCRPFILLVTLFLTAVIWGGGFVVPALAQDNVVEALTQDEYQAWSKVALRAEEALEAGRASEQAFESLRRELVEWRSRFQDARSLHSGQLETLDLRIEALGEPPEEGQSESEDVAALRAELNDQRDRLLVPVVAANEAYSRADGLILQVDRLLRERQRAKLLSRGPTPIAPTAIAKALEDLETVWRVVSTEVGSSYSLQHDVSGFREGLVVAGILIAIGLLLLVRGRDWLQRIVGWMIRRGGESERVFVAAMVLSLGQVILPFLGMFFLFVALMASGLLGSVGEALAGQLLLMGLAYFTARWLGGQTFPKEDDWPWTFDLSAHERRRGRFYFQSLGILFMLAILLSGIDDIFVMTSGSVQVLAFPVIVLSSICLAGLSRILIAKDRKPEPSEPDAIDDDEAPDEWSFLGNIIGIIGRVGIVFAVAAPILGLIGYSRAAVYSSLSPSLSLALLALVTYLQRLSVGIFALFAPPGKSPGDGLWPVLVNVLILVASLPLFALIWGVRRADLLEFWSSLNEGILIGESRISPTVIIAFLAVFIVGYVGTRLFQGVMRNSILPRTRLDPGAQKAAVSGLGYVGLFIAAMLAVSVAGLDLSNLAIVAGALSVGVGFGLQNVVSNFVSGLILLIERPVTEGDWIEVGGVMGTVRKISVRATTVETFDRTDVIVPNSDFVSNQVTNWTRGNLSGRLILPVGVAYGTDTRKVAAILQEVAEAHPLVIVNPPPLIVFQGFGADSLDFEVRVILRDINFGLGTRTELNHRIAERFAEEGIEIPFAQRDIWLRNPEALRSGPVPQQGIVSTASVSPDSVPEFPSEDDT